MQIETVVAPLLGANCYLLRDEHRRCVVVDPGAGVLEDVATRVQDAGLRPLAILLTHGHVDHTWSAGGLAGLWHVPVIVHAADAHRLLDPFGTLGALGPQLERTAAAAGLRYRAPDDVRGFEHDGAASTTLRLAGGDEPAFDVVARHAPGHTEGSTVYLVDADGPVAFTGDVLFAGTIGRTDLPGGDPDAMTRTLADLAGLDPVTRVLPGHGPSSTVDTELRSNPFLR